MSRRTTSGCSRSSSADAGEDPGRPASDVEADVEDVAVGDDVGLALESLQAAPGRLGVRAGLQQVVRRDHLAADEPARDVGVDRRRRVERGLSVAERPRARLLLAGGSRRSGSAHPSSGDDLVERRRPIAERRRLLVGELGELGLGLAVDASGAFSIAISGIVVSGSSAAGSSAGQSARVLPASRCDRSAASVSASLRFVASPDLASFATRSRRRST